MAIVRGRAESVVHNKPRRWVVDAVRLGASPTHRSGLLLAFTMRPVDRVGDRIEVCFTVLADIVVCMLLYIRFFVHFGDMLA